jgi:hypothetical protein
MSKARQRHTQAARTSDIPGAPVWERIPHKAVFFALILAAIPFSAGKYIEFHSPGAFDSGAYLYSAHRVLNGAIPGPTESVTAKAGTLLVNMLGISLFGYNDAAAKMIQMFLQIAALVTMFFVMRKIFGSLAAGVALFVASFYLSAPLIAKYGNVKEQYAIAIMMLGISMLLMRQMGGKWYWGLLAGAFLSWGPMFKETGLSAIIATFIFLFLQPILKNRPWKLVGRDFAFILLGGVLAIAPVQIWISYVGSPAAFNPYVQLYRFGANTLRGYIVRPPAPKTAAPASDSNKPAAAPKAAPAVSGIYITRAFTSLREQADRVFRWYAVLIFPVVLAAASIGVRAFRALGPGAARVSSDSAEPYERLVLLLGLWWLTDMVFVWVSPRPWEEYYLPLCASAAATGGYLVAMYSRKTRSATSKGGWILAGIVGLLFMIMTMWPIVFGLHTSPQTGSRYQAATNGYVQRWRDTREGGAPWEEVAQYIKKNSKPQDKIYVWGWFPGIYVESQRDSASTSLPFTSEAHVVTPRNLADQAKDLLASFEREKPKFLVDTRKLDTPFVYPPLEFWPFIPERGFLPNDPTIVKTFDAKWREVLVSEITSVMSSKGSDIAPALAEDEAKRFDAMKPLRDYVMANYDIVMKDQYRTMPNVGLYGPFGTHVLFVRKASAN